MWNFPQGAPGRAPAPIPGRGYATAGFFSYTERRRGGSAPAPKEMALPPPESLRLSAESYDYGAILLGDSQDWVVVVHNDGELESTILSLGGITDPGLSLPDPPVLPQTFRPRGHRRWRSVLPRIRGGKRPPL